MYVAASRRHVCAIKVLLRAKANLLLTHTNPSSNEKHVPLDQAAFHGHRKVAREPIQERGIKGCGGASRGLDDLRLATANDHVDTMEVLSDATSIARLLHDDGGTLVSTDTTLAYATGKLRGEKRIGGRDATEEKLHKLEAGRRLMLQEAAVHAVSWLWAGDSLAAIYVDAAGGAGRTKTSSNPVIMRMMPIMRRRNMKRTCARLLLLGGGGWNGYDIDVCDIGLDLQI